MFRIIVLLVLGVHSTGRILRISGSTNKRQQRSDLAQSAETESCTRKCHRVHSKPFAFTFIIEMLSRLLMVLMSMTRMNMMLIQLQHSCLTGSIRMIRAKDAWNLRLIDVCLAVSNGQRRWRRTHSHTSIHCLLGGGDINLSGTISKYLPFS